MEKTKRFKSFTVSTTQGPGKQSEFVLGIDEILPHVGDFGRYQKLMIGLVGLLYIPIAVPLLNILRNHHTIMEV